MTLERRRQRSTTLAVALRYYLEALAARCQLAAVAVADADGRLLAGTGPSTDLRLLAALGVAQARGMAGAARLLAGSTDGTELYTLEVENAGKTLTIAGVTARPAPESLEPVALPETPLCEDLGRILRTT